MSKKKHKTTQPANAPVNTQNNHPSIMAYFFDFSEKLASFRALRWAAIVLLPALILLIYHTEINDQDLWWQMALGKYYLTHHTLTIDHSIFSWTPTDPGWIYNTCLGSIFFYVTYTLMGGFGLCVVQWLIFLGIFLSFYLFLRLIRQRLDITSVAVISAIGVAMSLTCTAYKPELFSMLLFTWMVFIFFCVKLIRKTILFYLYPFIFALWVNLHGGFIFGFVFLALAFLGELLNRFFFPKESFTTKDLAHMGAACALSLLATLLNPYGMEYLVSVYNIATSESYQSGIHQYIEAYISLWPYLKDINQFFLTKSQTAWIMCIMILFLGCLFLYDLIRKRACDFTLLIVNVVLFWYGMGTGRASYFFALGFFFSFFYLLQRLNLMRNTAKATVFSLMVIIFFFVNISNLSFRYTTDNKWFGAGLDSLVPAEEVAFLKKYKIGGSIFNDYGIGGYLIWALYPDYKVFIDPRFGPYWKQVLPDFMSFANNPVNRETIQRFTEKYPFKIAIIHYQEVQMIIEFLRAGGDWRLLYFGQNAAILVHKSLVPSLMPEMRAINISPLRFGEVRKPQVLCYLFDFYILYSPELARSIHDIYEKNVSDYYMFKPEHLQVMAYRIRQKELEIQALAERHKTPSNR